MRDAVQKKALLLLHDRARDLDDRALALVERAHEPVGTRELLGQPRLAFRRGALSQFAVIAAVDEQAGQGGPVDLDRPTLDGPEDIHLRAGRPASVLARFCARFRRLTADNHTEDGSVNFA